MIALASRPDLIICAGIIVAVGVLLAVTLIRWAGAEPDRPTLPELLGLRPERDR